MIKGAKHYNYYKDHERDFFRNVSAVKSRKFVPEYRKVGIHI